MQLLDRLAVFEVEVGDVVVAVLSGPFAWGGLSVGGDGRGREEREEDETADHDEGGLHGSVGCDGDCETDGCLLKFLILHVLLGSVEGVVADVDPSAERPIDVGDGEQDQGDEEGEGKDLEGVKPAICRAKH